MDEIKQEQAAPVEVQAGAPVETGNAQKTTVTVSKKTVQTAAVVIVLLVLAPFAFAALDLYAFHWNNTTLMKVADKLHYPVIMVDGEMYSRAEYQTELDNLERVLRENKQILGREELSKMLDERLVRAAAVKRASKGRDLDMDAALKLAAMVTFGENTDQQQIKETIEEQFGWSYDYFYSHVLTPYARELAFAMSVLKPQIEAISGAVREPGADFAAIAKEKGEDASKDNGGDLGWFKTGAMVPEFEEKVFNAGKGDIVGPFFSRFGWHVVMVTDVRGDGLDKEVRASHIIVSLQNHENDIEPLITEAAKDVKVRKLVKE